MDPGNWKLFCVAGFGLVGIAGLGYKFYSNTKWQNYSYDYSKLQDDLEKQDSKTLNNVVLVGEVEPQDKAKSYNERGPVAVEVTYEEKQTQSWGSWLWSWIGQRHVKKERSLKTECCKSDDFTMTSKNCSIIVKDMKRVYEKATERGSNDDKEFNFIMAMENVYSNVKKDGQDKLFYVLTYGTTLYALGEAKLEKQEFVFRPMEIGRSIKSYVWMEKIFCLFVIGGIVLIGLSVYYWHRNKNRMNDER